jgi:tetratricopeptide (TPR) repeat protein
MTAILELDHLGPSATDGEIAAINLESARRGAWARFRRDPRLPGAAETLVDHERLTSQFLGDLDALDRLDALATRFAEVDDSYRAALVQAEVAATAHRFAEARAYLARAQLLGGPREAIERQTLAIDQACGVELEAVLAARRRIAAASGGPEDLVPLGAVLADLQRFTEADAVYRQAISSYNAISPFLPAWVCFQLGMLWGELAPVVAPSRAALWYRRALAYLPGYVKARVHLAEICLSQDQIAEAEALLLPALTSGDPEVRWRLTEALTAQERVEEAAIHLEGARVRFEELLGRHLLAFADHAAEFYAGPGNDHRRALELARVNVANRPTRRAAEQERILSSERPSMVIS